MRTPFAAGSLLSQTNHNVLLEILLILRKWLVHNIVLLEKHGQETNWKQKFQKPQNENICLTNLNECRKTTAIFRFWHLKVTTQWSKKRGANELK